MKYIYSIIAVILMSLSSSAQQNIVSSEDISTTQNLISEYLSPLGEGIGTGLNCGWWTTAKPHKILGFDLSISLNSVEIPESGLIFNYEDVIYDNNNFTSDPNSLTTSTVFGDAYNANITYNVNSSSNINIVMPQGLNVKNVIVPTLNLGIGVIKKTDIVIRYIPEIKFKEYLSMQVFGGGVKHDILQYIPVANKLPFDLSVMSNFTNLSVKTNISGLSTSNGSDVEIKCKAFSTNVIASKKIALITLFGGIGHNYTYSNLDVDSDIILSNSLSINANDILTTKFGKMHDMKVNIGVRLQILLVNVNASYNWSAQGYNTISFGLSSNLR